MTAGRRLEIVRALLDADGAAVSGEALAGRLGISRAGVGKHIAALREAGFEIVSAHRAGHRLVSAPLVTLPETVAPLVGDPMWVRFEGAAETPSTNDDAKRLARAGAPEGTVVVAASQAGGRGRLGRVWSSPEGGAYFSVVLRPGLPPAGISSLALAVAVGVAEGLAALGVETRLKWPNDVLVDGRKLAGILLEMSAEADKVEWVVAGVGVDVRRPEGATGEFAYVADVAPDVSPAVVAASVLDAFAGVYRRYVAGGFAGLVAEYVARDALAGREVSVRDAMGSLVAGGIAGGVDDEGRLLVGDTAVSAGEVTLRDVEGGGV